MQNQVSKFAIKHLVLLNVPARLKASKSLRRISTFHSSSHVGIGKHCVCELARLKSSKGLKLVEITDAQLGLTPRGGDPVVTAAQMQKAVTL